MTSDHKKYLIYQKTKGICILCAKPIGENRHCWTIDHYIPRAIYKWVPNSLLKKKLESLENLFIVHQQCNINKDADLPNLKSIRSLKISQELKLELIQLYKDVQQEIFTYRTIKQKVLVIQQFKCFFCNKKISISDSTLRRQNNKEKRLLSNAMCLCLKCSIRAGNPHYKRNMVKRKIKKAHHHSSS